MGAKEQGTIKELVQAALSGENAAYEALYYATAAKMMGLAWSVLRQEQDAMDVLQESYLYAFNSLADLQKPESFESWLYSIVFNRCKNYLTRIRPKMSAASITDEEGVEWEFSDDDLSFRPEEYAGDMETQRIVREMVDALPEDQRACILLYYFQEMKVGEISQLLELSENTVKSRLSYARKKLLAQAQELESQGTVLHGAAFIPLVTMAARQVVGETIGADGELIIQGVMTQIGKTGAASLAAAGQAVPAKTFLGTLTGKALVGGALLLAIAGGITFMQSSQLELEPEPESGVIVSQPEPELEPEPVQEAAPYYTVTILLQDEDGTPFSGILVLGIRMGEYTIIINDRVVPSYKSLYSERETAEGRITVTPDEAETLGIVLNFSDTSTSISFDTQENYSLSVLYENSTIGFSHTSKKADDHTVVFERYADPKFGYRVRASKH